MVNRVPVLIAFGLLVLASMPGAVWAGWLDLGLGGQPLARGGAVTATVGGPTAVAWNAAGLAWAGAKETALLAGLAPAGALGRAWLGGLSWGNEGWGMGFVYEAAKAEELYAGGVAVRFGELITLGLAAHRLAAAGGEGEGKGEAKGVDLGVLLRPLPRVRLGLNFLNLVHDPGLASATRAGLGAELGWLVLTGELVLRAEGPWGWGIGAELWPLRPLVLALGMADWGHGLGLELATERLGVAFAFVMAEGAEGWFLSTTIRI